MNNPQESLKPTRNWPFVLWILFVCLFFPVVALGWTIAIAEGVYGDMEPMFAVAGTLVSSVAAAIFTAVSLFVALAAYPKVVSRLLVVITVFEVISIPLCRLIVKHGQHQREEAANFRRQQHLPFTGSAPQQ